jgi:type IV pilus assembly protein PilY1
MPGAIMQAQCGYAPFHPTGDDNPNYMLDDVAKLLATQELQHREPPVVDNFDTSGQQSLRIHSISYGATNNLLRNTAAVGNGLYFTATDPDTLQAALRGILCSSGARTSACPATP